MTIENEDIVSGPYEGNDVTTAFDYTFRIEDKTQIIVFETDDDGVQTTLTVDVDYTVNDVGTDGGGSIDRIAGALPTNYSWYIRANYDLNQETAFASQGSFLPEVHERAFDKLTYICLQLLDKITRSVKVSDSYSSEVNTELPSPSAGKSPRWNPAANAFVNSNYDIDEVGAAVAGVGDSVTAAAASAAAAALSEANAAVSEANAVAAAAVIDGFENRGAWSTSTFYETNNFFTNDGSTYIANEDHTSDASSIATDLGAGRVSVLAAKGAPGAGTGDMLGSNNLSDVNDPAAALAALGGLALAGGTLTGAVNQKSANVAANATSSNIWTTGNFINLTGSVVTFTDVADAPIAGAWRLVRSNAAHILTNNANIAVQGDDDYTLAAGDLMLWHAITTTEFEVFIFGYTDPNAAESHAGEIFDWSLDTVPDYALYCDGSAVSRTTYAALFDVIGTTYGAGDGSTTFNLPDIPLYYTTVQGNGSNAGNTTTGDNKAHAHTVATYTSNQYGSTNNKVSNEVKANSVAANQSTSSSGLSQNRAAGMYVRKCIRIR